MTGELIRFERRRDARKDLRVQPLASCESDGRGGGIIELRVARITRFIARGTIADDLEGAPQPVLDDEGIERMYRKLYQDA